MSKKKIQKGKIILGIVAVFGVINLIVFFQKPGGSFPRGNSSVDEERETKRENDSDNISRDKLIEITQNKTGRFSSSITVKTKKQSIQDIYRKETSQSNVTDYGWKAIQIKNGEGWFVGYKWEI